MDVQSKLNDGTMRNLTTPLEEIVRFHTQALLKLDDWKTAAINHPDSFETLEREVDAFFREGAGYVVGALLCESSKSDTVKSLVDAIQRDAETPLRNPVKQSLLVRMMCGLVFTITTLYNAPARKASQKDDTELRQGLYPELAAYGFAKKSSAALEDRVVRAATLYPSFEIARRELAVDGLDLDVKEIRRITLQCGESLLAIRRDKVKRFLSGTMTPGVTLKGKNVVVEEDGGRMRHRETIKSDAKEPGSHPKFKAEWREPKLFIIYCVDENGKKEKDSEVHMDATLQGADHAAELLASTLFEHGAMQASSVTILADGANCLWDRFDWIVDAVGLDRQKVKFVLDFFHASQHVSLAVAELGYDNTARRDLYVELRRELRHNCWETVVSRLENLGAALLEQAELEKEMESKDKTGASVFLRELNYLRKHGKAGHLSYEKFTRRGLPLGSGAVESAIRRVINLRLKGNGMFWTPENAEKLLQLRCQLLSTEWKVCREKLRCRRRRTRSMEWRWSASDRSFSARNGVNARTPNPTKCRNSSIQTP